MGNGGAARRCFDRDRSICLERRAQDSWPSEGRLLGGRRWTGARFAVEKCFGYGWKWVRVAECARSA